MKIRELIMRLSDLPLDMDIFMNSEAQYAEFVIVPISNGDRHVMGYLITEASTSPTQLKLPLSGNVFDEPKDSIGE